MVCRLAAGGELCGRPPRVKGVFGLGLSCRLQVCVRPVRAAMPLALMDCPPPEAPIWISRLMRIGIVNLAARGMLVVSVARRLGSEVLCSPIVMPRSNRAEPKKAPWVGKLTMRAEGLAILSAGDR